MKAIARRSGAPSWIASSRRSAIPPSAPGAPDQGQVGAALAGGDQVRVEAGEQPRAAAPSELREVSTRCASAPQALGQRRGEARRALLQQGDVPVGAGEQRRELVEQVAVDLDVGGVALARSAAAASARCSSAGSGGKSRPWKRFQAMARELHAA